MKNFKKSTITLLLLVLAITGAVRAQAPVSDPALATVRIKSHGASATIIATSPGRSWILGCAHMLMDKKGRPSQAMREKAFIIDGPAQPGATTLAPAGPPKLAAWDYELDLSLIVTDWGPLHYIPVAPAGFRPGKNLLSAGYDEMRWPITIRPATLLASDDSTSFTREKPWHGRSGGGLCDRDAGVLIGVVQGYEVPPGGNRGIYISHKAILRFLKTALPGFDENLASPRALPRPQSLQAPFFPCPT
jgi:hypothetical protein